MIDPIGVPLPQSGAAEPPRPGEPTTPPRRPEHLGAVDVVRFLTVGGVIAVHSTSLTAPSGSVAAGGVLVVLHITRSVFLFLSAFVLGYSFLKRPLAPRAFWRRRYPLVAIPYAVWSAIYVLTGHPSGNPLKLLGTYALDLLDGGAHFHLYFLLLTFQLYLIFPALIAFFRRHPAAQRPVLMASVAFELGFTAAVHYDWRPPVLGIWFDHPGTWLPSYELYVVGGLIAALHFEAVTSWVRAHGRLIASAFAAAVALAIASYLADLSVVGYSPLKASEVFQPVVVLEATTGTLAQYALGLWAVDRLRARPLALLKRSSDVSFGVYLAHPLLIATILDVATAIGLASAVGPLPSGLVEAMVVFGLVPFVYGVTFAVVAAVRRTRLSVALTGRRAAPAATARS
jgi:peptidoglycan/LPS O-acetylase OafA/YrhL